jgi:hypothetical protein
MRSQKPIGKEERNMQAWDEWRRLAFSQDGTDTTAGIDDAELALAIKGTGDLMDAAELLTEAHGRVVARNDVARRVEGSAELQRTYAAARVTYINRTLANGLRRQAEKRQARRADASKSAEGGQGLDPASVSLQVPRLARADLRFYPTDALCGARTRRGNPCRRIVEPGARRCRLHGGASTGPRTAEGRQRIADAQRARWRRYREERGR